MFEWPLRYGDYQRCLFRGPTRTQTRVLPTTILARRSSVATHRRATQEVSAAADEYCHLRCSLDGNLVKSC